ncbi:MULTISPECIES: hypothetical protein [unclassified Mammaliicoccus]|uniref:hypothetical protein n=1 Tax=unclassified Mammaliicoccus TaxID=2803851 RepID=UPI001EFB7DB7|nr:MULTISPECIES: hypothetical protein [unclassified Mammaliicoccus]
MPTIKYTREDITKLKNERDQLKHQGNLLREDIALLKKNQKTRDKLIDNLKEENKNLNNERDSLIKDVEKLRGALIKSQIKYINLTEHIKYKAWNNPGNSRYIALVHFIDEIEGD